MIKSLAALTAAVLTVGCATVMNDTTQPVRVETQTAAGQTVNGADCRLTNDAGTITMKSGDTVPVRRSGQDLDIVCKHADHPDAQGRAISRANAGLAGNILIGGGIGAIIDHSKGTAYTYPSWLQLVFGRTLIFDRRAEKDGQPMAGVEPAASAPAPAPAPAR